MAGNTPLILYPPWKNVFLRSWHLRFFEWDFKNWVNQWMATNISYILMHKSNFFETFLNNLQTVSIQCRKQLKKVGILRVKGCSFYSKIIFQATVPCCISLNFVPFFYTRFNKIRKNVTNWCNFDSCSYYSRAAFNGAGTVSNFVEMIWYFCCCNF